MTPFFGLTTSFRAADRKDFSYQAKFVGEGPLPSPLAEQAVSKHLRYWREPQLVDFYTFKLDYWGQFSRDLIRNLSMDLVFAEIMGVIKGSVTSRITLVPLSRAEYLGRSSKLAPAFTIQSERERVYDIFEAYEKIKTKFGDVDYMDRITRLLTTIRENSTLRDVLSRSFDELYIDGERFIRRVCIIHHGLQDNRGSRSTIFGYRVATQYYKRCTRPSFWLALIHSVNASTRNNGIYSRGYGSDNIK